MPALVRQGSAADLDALAPLFDAYRRFYGQPANLALARRFLEERLSRGESTVLLAQRDVEAVGFVQLYASFSSVQARRIFILNDLYVAPAARRLGIARALLAAAADFGRAAGAARLTLATARDNASAQALYESCGWVRNSAFFQYDLPLD